MGFDEYHPLTHSGSNLSSNGIGYTVADALDTMYIMGKPLREEYTHARDWIERELTFEHAGPVSTFEVRHSIIAQLYTRCVTVCNRPPSGFLEVSSVHML